MGAVYLAVREDDRFRRQVALKVIKRGMDTEEILRRFHLERQVLSALTHPNIARLLDGGAMDDGRPFFVLEYIEGQTIDAFCDANGLNVEQRLRLFQKVCSAVHYAHQNLVVHRDLKPHNILVTLEGEPKLLDFGIAKLINTQLMQVTVATGPQMRLMTPEYASPEQVRGAPVSTASDVYSLGALLYEILTGHRPYRFESRIEQEIVRVVCEVDPERPSAAVSRIEEVRTSDGATRRVTPETVARVREGDPTRLRRRLSGDLDDIVLKAMEKAPPKRYPSAQQMAEDIQRHIDGMPVDARAGRGAAYRAQKFVRRRRTLVGSAGAVFAALVLGLLATTWQWRLAEAARDRARNAAEAAGAVVDGVSNSVARLDGLVAVSTEGEAAQRPLDEAVARLDALHREVEGQEDAVRRVLQRGLVSVAMLLGDRAGGSRGPNAGDNAGALRAYRVAADMLSRTALSETELLRQTFSLYTRLGDAQHADGLQDESMASYEAAERAARRLAAGDGGAPALRRVSVAMMSVAQSLLRAGNAEGALPIVERAVSIREDLARTERTTLATRDLGVGLSTLGETLQALGRFDEAERAFVRCIEVRRTLVDAPPQNRHQRDLAVAQTRSLADLLLKEGESARALAQVEEAWPTLERLRDQDPQDARAAADLVEAAILGARALRDLQRDADARAWTDRAAAGLDDARRRWPDELQLMRQDAAVTMLRGDLERRAGANAEAAAWFRRAVGAYRAVGAHLAAMGRDLGDVERRGLGLALWKQGEADRAAAEQSDGEARRGRLASARTALNESLVVYRDLSQKGKLAPGTEALTEIPRLIALCDAALGG
ncbi:MAG: serine/threonine protein kinase, partial [Phycisphaerales bacterium]|nr:serine/threonine protein kinase [Phycisphaerales bacterium]